MWRMRSWWQEQNVGNGLRSIEVQASILFLLADNHKLVKKGYMKSTGTCLCMCLWQLCGRQIDVVVVGHDDCEGLEIQNCVGLQLAEMSVGVVLQAIVII